MNSFNLTLTFLSIILVVVIIVVSSRQYYNQENYRNYYYVNDDALTDTIQRTDQDEIEKTKTSCSNIIDPITGKKEILVVSKPDIDLKNRVKVEDCSVLHGNCDKWYQIKNDVYSICVKDQDPRSISAPPGESWCKSADSKINISQNPLLEYQKADRLCKLNNYKYDVVNTINNQCDPGVCQRILGDDSYKEMCNSGSSNYTCCVKGYDPSNNSSQSYSVSKYTKIVNPTQAPSPPPTPPPKTPPPKTNPKCNYPRNRTQVADCSVVHGDCDQWYQNKNGSLNICMIDSVPRSTPPPPGQNWCKPDDNICTL